MPKAFIPLIVVGSIIVVSAVVAVNSQSNNSVSPVTNQPTPTPSPVLPDKEEENHDGYEEPAGEREVTVIGIDAGGFTPQTLHVTTGHTIAFLNNDAGIHAPVGDTTTDGITSFNLGEIQPGQHIAAGEYDTPGTYTYHCKLHPHEKGTIIVE